MIDSSDTAEPARPATRNAWLRLAALALTVVALGVPINGLLPYAVLLISAVLILCGRIDTRAARWLGAFAAVAVAALLPLLIAPAPIQQGANVFLPTKPGNVIERQMPPDVYRFMKAEFDALYPPSVRCKSGSEGCWQDQGYPDRLYAFSADGVFGNPTYSRAVTGIDFSDPLWLRLGFVNDNRYNWYTAAPDLHRADRNREFWMGLWRWRTTMPWFVMHQFPADYAGSNLCWRGDVLWPEADGRYQPIRHAGMACRTVSEADIGRQIFAAAIKPGSLAMTLHAPAGIKARLIAGKAVSLLAVIALLVLLLRVRPADTVRPFVLIGLALIVIAVIDASLIGGWRPMDGGDDGLFYTGVGRQILEHLVNGDIAAALIGGEKVYYYGGPGLRYFRALEMIVFGDTSLGYLSLVLAMPIIVLGLFKRFMSDAFAWRLALVFTIIPVGEIYGSTFLDYAKWAARGFADPTAHILLIWGVLVVVAARAGPPNRFANAAAGSLLMALAVFTKPLVAPMVGIVLGGAGLAALATGQWRRVVGLCIGFLPFFMMPLHNWYFGHQFVLLSTNADQPTLLVMPPSAWLAALSELAHLNFAGAHLQGALTQIAMWLSGPGESLAFIPFNAASVAVVAYVTLRGRDFDPWLRLIGAAVLAECVVGLIYIATPRYFFGMWLLSAVVVATFLEQRLLPWLEKSGWLNGPVFAKLLGTTPNPKAGIQ
jgi:hypothetical protein